MAIRRCKTCGETFPLTTEYFEKTGKGYFRRDCKSCYSLQRRNTYASNPEPAKARANEWRKSNPELKKERDKEYAAKHPERMAEKKRRWVENNPDRRLEISRAYRKRNPGQNTQAAAQWRNANPDSQRAIKLRRRAKERGLPDAFTATDWQHALAYFDGRCAVCSRPPGLWHTLAADHWIPITAPDCPGTVPQNIVPLCHGVEGCNNSKSNRDPIEWLTARVGSKKATHILERIAQYFKTVRK
jgi:hypothetical protein